jgi:hypothetical protein
MSQTDTGNQHQFVRRTKSLLKEFGITDLSDAQIAQIIEVAADDATDAYYAHLDAVSALQNRVRQIKAEQVIIHMEDSPIGEELKDQKD